MTLSASQGDGRGAKVVKKVVKNRGRANFYPRMTPLNTPWELENRSQNPKSLQWLLKKQPSMLPYCF